MAEESPFRLERMVSRRRFLRGSTLTAAAVVGVAAAPLLSFAQGGQDDKKKDGKKDDGKTVQKPEGGGKELRDAEGREYRVCPQCNAPMYKQDRTWTCEACGYSYVES